MVRREGSGAHDGLWPQTDHFHMLSSAWQLLQPKSQLLLSLFHMAPTDWELAFSETLRDALGILLHWKFLSSESSVYCKNKIMDINSSILFRADNNGSWQSYISILQEEISCIYLKLIGKRSRLPCLWGILGDISVWGVSAGKTLFLNAHHTVGSWEIGTWAGMYIVRCCSQSRTRQYCS